MGRTGLISRWLTAAVVLAALLSRLAYSEIRARRLDALVVADMRTYHLLAVTLAERGYYGVEKPWSYRPPLYPFFLAAVYRAAGIGWPAARIAQACLGALSAWLLLLLGRPLLTFPAALLAALLLALDPALVHLSGLLLSENLYVPLSLLLLLLLLRGLERGRPADFILAGAAGGFSALCRPSVLPFLLLALVPCAAGLRSGKADRPARIWGWGLMLLSALVVIGPWTLRNYRVHRRFVPISTNGGVMLWMGLHPGASGDYDFPREGNPLYGMTDEVERDRAGTRESLSFLRENPLEALALAGRKFLLFWEFFPSTGSGKAFALFLAAAAAGLVLSLKEWRRWLLIYLYAASFLGNHLLVHSGYRYRYALHPVLALFAAAALVALGSLLRARFARLIRARPHFLALYNTLKFFGLRYPKRELLDWKRTRLFLAVKPYTMLSYRRMSLLFSLACRLEESRLPGAIVECGSWNGGSAGLMAYPSRGNPQREVWLFDSWEGLPDPGPADVHCTGRPGEKGDASGSVAAARRLLFRRLRLDPGRIHLVKGWFADTMPSRRGSVGPVALLHLDCDWYASVKYCLEMWYDQVREGGFLVVDDYGEWRGCRRAVDEFFRERGLAPELLSVDFNGRYFQKRERSD